MKKCSRRIIGVFILFVVAVVAFCSYNILSSSHSAHVSRNENLAKTTDGAACNNDQEMSGEYNPKVSFSQGKATITVKKGSFRVTNVTNGEILTNNPMDLGVVTPDSPMEINFNTSASTDVVLHFVLAETDDTCLSYDEAPFNSDGQKAGTYEFDMTLQLKPQMDTPLKDNKNYNGICSVFRTGTGYENYAAIFKEAGVSKSDIEKYNYSAVDANQKGTYDSIIPYCLSSNQVTFNYTEEQTASLIASAILIVRNQASVSGETDVSESFMTAFNDAKSKALSLGHDYTNLVKNGSIDDTRFGMTCDWKLEESDSDYYVNKDYYYAKEVDTKNIKYTYHYTSGKTEEVSGGSCTRTCEESVVVEYGPPVASKAGLCFEYKVRVTSRVVCDSSLKLQPPTTPSICTPTPYCNQVSGFTHQGGPNEDFEKCIQECDGGKYSQSCSNKCYSKVYANDESNVDLLAIRYGNQSIVQKMWSSSFPGYNGRYVWKNGNIVWEGSGYGRWYEEFEDARTRGDHGHYNVYSGFKKADYGDGDVCADNCYWSGCSANSYLNESDAAKDTVNNMKKYNQAIASCSGSASCTTKTAEFTIGIDYTDTAGEDHTVDFPLASSKVDSAKLPSHGEGFSGTTSGTEIFIPELTITPEDEDGYAGCYDDASAKNWYQVAWSFPGTWINNKTGEISYVNKGNDTAWHKQEDKFCMPLNAASLNQTWWNWKLIDKNTSVDESDIDYNIHAATTDFGYFGWNFDFECFYALQNEEVCTGDDCDSDSDTTISTEDYVFRIVDLNNLFPESEESTEKNESKLEITGRQPGYNWTLDADNVGNQTTALSLTAKNTSYPVNPIELIQDIQSKGNSIYSDEYLDYRITLDSDALKYLRNYNKQYKYTDYQGSTAVKNGVTAYRSSVITKLNPSKRAGYGNNTGKGA